MNKRLITAAFAEEKERSSELYSGFSVKQASNGIIGSQMEIGTWNMMQAMQTDHMFLLDEFITANDT